MGEFNLVLLKIGEQKFYCPVDKAMEILQCLTQANLLQITSVYGDATFKDVAIPLREGICAIQSTNPAKAFMLIRAGEEHMENKE